MIFVTTSKLATLKPIKGFPEMNHAKNMVSNDPKNRQEMDLAKWRL
jgi:hypothetical protein